MAQIFPPYANTLARASLAGAVVALAVGGWVVYKLRISGYMTGVDRIPEQPVPFSHKHHVSGLGIDCRYCHVSVETAAFAGVPATRTCMTCHSQIWTNAPVLAPVRDANVTGAPIPWTRVNALPDYVFFNHSVHIHAGVACIDCHGEVMQMPLTRGQYPFRMKDCLLCHRDPERYPGAMADVRRYLAALPPGPHAYEEARALHIRRITDCYACHR